MNIYFSSNWHQLGKQQRAVTLALITIGIVLILTAFIIGVSDNLPGISVLFLGMISLALSVTHIWKGYKIYLKLFLFSVIGFFVAVLLHNLLYAFAELNHDLKWLNYMINLASTFFFVLAVLIFPVTTLIGLVGMIVSFFRPKRNSKKIPL
jgi:hypothetical protein